MALIENGEPVYGAVYAPVPGKLYWGARGEGAYMAEVKDGQIGPSQPIRVRIPPAGGIAAVGSRSHGGDETQAYLKAFDVAEFKAAGSSLKFCLVAEGVADLYPRMGPTMEWDTAAGDAVLRAAGGRVETLDRSPLAYGKPGFRNPHFVAFGDPGLSA
jgi:sulfate adenylyltransferase subunit 2/3'(2'), 5'-bisphosphate nucleotidase